MNALRVELVYFPGCPNVEAAREAIRDALSAECLPVEWREWDRDDPATPPALRRYGSPSVLVNGRDVAPTQTDARCCRVYTTENGLYIAPGIETIRAALRVAVDGKGHK